MHKTFKQQNCQASLTTGKGSSTYTLDYPALDRKLSITFESSFPHTIESWTEEYISGYGANKQKLTTSGKKIKTILSDYWNKNSTNDIHLRDTLGL